MDDVTNDLTLSSRDEGALRQYVICLFFDTPVSSNSL